MVIDIINEFREKNNKERIFAWNPIENDYCFQHCLYMARQSYLVHAPEFFRKNKAEAVAVCTFMEDNEKTIRYLLYECIGKSQEHRDVVLNYDNLAYGFYIYDYTAFLTIRGW
jgi:hypothetical protein